VNKDVFQAAGVAVPTAEEWTWAKMLEVCQALKDNTNKVLAANQEINVFYPMSFDPSWAPVYLTMFKNYGVELASNGKAFDGTEENIYACLNEMLSLQTKGYMSFGGNVNITTGELGLAVGGVRTGVPNYEMYEVNYEVLPFPSQINGNSYVACGAVGYGMTSSCPEDKKEIAWKFLSYMFSEEGQEEFSKSGAICPVMKSLLEKEDAEWKKYSKVDDTAFYAYPERDIKVTFLQDFQPVEQHTSIYNNYTYMFEDLYKDKYNGRQTVEAFYSHYSKQIEQEMK
jgi:ABC-type glycerol-3-phosphate transport system substrate-binding protein